MALDGENLIAAKCHRVFGQIHDGIAKGQNAALKKCGLGYLPNYQSLYRNIINQHASFGSPPI